MNILTLLTGCLIVLGKPTMVHTVQANVTVNKGAVAFIKVFPETTVVYNLHQHAPHHLAVQTIKEKICIAPARVVFVTRLDSSSFQGLQGLSFGVQYINPKRIGHNLWVANFDIESLMAAEPEFQTLLDSTDDEKTHILDLIMKTAVILQPKSAEPVTKPYIGKHCQL